MTPNEFKAWFEGFTEAMDGQPTAAQWAKVRDRVAEIDGKPVTERIYIDQYIERYWPRPWREYRYGEPLVARLSSGARDTRPVPMAAQQSAARAFDSYGAMKALGAAEYVSSDS
jgi:hypothetical protein